VITEKRDIILSVTGLKKYFPVRKGLFHSVHAQVKAVDGVTIDIDRGETIGLAGESGCGKTTTIRSAVRVVEPTEGKVVFTDKHGKSTDITGLKEKHMAAFRKHIHYVFQDPFSSLDPRMTIMDIVSEPLRIHNMFRGRKRKERVAELIRLVGLNPAHLGRYPHAFSGGQRQRIGIARALALEPELLLLDEPTSALDVSVQAQIINLLIDLQKEFNLTYIVVAHDLVLLESFCDRIAVMFLGQIMELASSETLAKQPLHPYTKALLSAVPIADPDITNNIQKLAGEPPDAAKAPSGCKFRTRCPIAKSICAESEPQLKEISTGHFVKCHFVTPKGKD
jgi:oligopeptide/dipeptide ABC transporter ATP-binding protein